MKDQIHHSKKNILLNALLIGLFSASVLVFLYLSHEEPSLSGIFLLLLIDFPIIAYFLAINNTIKFIITNDQLLITYFTGSKSIQLQYILGFYYYTEPLFEFHIETSFLGSKLKRNNIGEFYYFSPGIRKGLIIEYGSEFNVEKLFIAPKNTAEFIDSLRFTLLESFNKNIDEFNSKFFVK